MKKAFVFTFAVLFLVAGVVSMAAAGTALNVANTNQKGSVLIFPKIDITTDETVNRETFIMISNDENCAVNVKCYWIRGEDQATQDFEFVLTKNQPAYFQASTGSNDGPVEPVSFTVPPFMGPAGALVCFAVDKTGTNQIRFNHLYGNAIVVDFAGNAEEGTAYSYNSWNYQALNGVAQGKPVGTPGQILLNGVDYDNSPQYLIFNFPALGAFDGLFSNVDLTLMSAIQDLRTQEAVLTHTKAKFDIWNENEVKYTGVYQCMNCWFENTLDNIQRWPEKFFVTGLHSDFGRFRVQGVAATTQVCPVPSIASPLLGLEVLWLDTDFDGDIDVTTALMPNEAGIDATGSITWDSAPPITPDKAKH